MAPRAGFEAWPVRRVRRVRFVDRVKQRTQALFVRVLACDARVACQRDRVAFRRVRQ